MTQEIADSEPPEVAFRPRRLPAEVAFLPRRGATDRHAHATQPFELRGRGPLVNRNIRKDSKMDLTDNDRIAESNSLQIERFSRLDNFALGG